MRLLRCLLVVLAATGVAAAALAVLVPLALTPVPGFEGGLVSGCAAVAAACAAWGWLSAVAVVGEALRALTDETGATPGRTPRSVPGVPPALRRLVLAACGVALSTVAGPALAAHGGDAHQGLPPVAAGLPFPARAVDLPSPTQEVAVVGPGDSLWAITRRHLPATARDAEIARSWPELYARNRAVVGDDPSLIHPGQHLVLPDRLEEPS